MLQTCIMTYSCKITPASFPASALDPSLLINPPPQHYPGRSFLIMPLVYQNQSFGALSVHFSQPVYPWTDQELELISTTTIQCAMAINHTQLIKQVQQQQQRENLLGQNDRVTHR